MDRFTSEFLSLAIDEHALALPPSDPYPDDGRQHRQRPQAQVQQIQEERRQEQQQQIAQHLQRESEGLRQREGAAGLDLTPQARMALHKAIDKEGVATQVFAIANELPETRARGLALATAFGLIFLQEIRARVCERDGSALSEVGGTSAKALATGVATWIAARFGLTDPASLGLAATVLYVLASAGRGAFCKMTEAELRRELGVKPAAG